MNCSRIKWNSCPRILVCADLISAWVLFWTCYDIVHHKEREQCTPLFHIVFREFLKRRLESKGKKVVNCTHTLLPRKTSWKGTEKWKLQTVTANYSQLSSPWCDIFHQKRSTKTALELLARSWNHNPRGKTQKLSIFDRLAFIIFSITAHGKVCFRRWMGVIDNLLIVRH